MPNLVIMDYKFLLKRWKKTIGIREDGGINLGRGTAAILWGCMYDFLMGGVDSYYASHILCGIVYKNRETVSEINI